MRASSPGVVRAGGRREADIGAAAAEEVAQATELKRGEERSLRYVHGMKSCGSKGTWDKRREFNNSFLSLQKTDEQRS